MTKITWKCNKCQAKTLSHIPYCSECGAYVTEALLPPGSSATPKGQQGKAPFRITDKKANSNVSDKD